MESTVTGTPAATSPAAPAAGGSVRRFLALVGITMLVVAISLLAITPRVVFWKDYPELTFETARVWSLSAQLQDPGGWEKAPLNNPLFGDNALRWRLLPPVIGHTLRLPTKIYLGLPWVGLFLLMGACLHYLRQRGIAPLGLMAAGVLIGTSAAFFGSSTSLGYFDCLYLLALVVLVFSPSPALAIGACVLGPWCDEKFLLMLPVCGCVRWSWNPSGRWVLGAALAVAVYCGVRLLALAGGDSSLSLQIAMQSKVFSHYWGSLPRGWWYGFRAGWVLVGTGVYFTWRLLPGKPGLLMLASLLAAIGAISFLAWDTTRSIAMLLPFFLVAASDRRMHLVIIGLAALNLVLPAAYLCCADPVTVPLTSCLR